MKPINSTDDEEDTEDDTKEAALEDRTKDYSNFKYIIKQLGEIYSAVERAYDDKRQQNAAADEAWDTYHCELNENQTYVGSSEVYVPIIRDALMARETRFINMLFPGMGRSVDIVDGSGHPPFDLIALMDNYVKQAKLRTTVAPAMIRTGDITGQYALYPEWIEKTRHIVKKKRVPEMTTELDTPVEGSPEYDDVEYEEVKNSRPGVMVLDARDFVILPATVDDVEDAEIVSITLRFSKNKIRRWIKEGIFEKEAGEMLIDNMGMSKRQLDTGKKMTMAAGVTLDSKGNKVALVQQTWCELKIRGERRLMVTHFANSELILGCKRNPYWCDRIPLITQAVEKNPGSIWGKSQVAPVTMLQYQANDYANMGFDSGMYSMLPIVMTDPEKNPRSGSMVLAMASVWLCDPNSTKFAEFPQLWKEAFTIIGAAKDQIFQSLGVNPAMIPHANAGRKPSQAQIAQEQQVALESSADNVALIQEAMFGQLIEWFYEMDYQYRTEAVTVQKFGTLGLQATMDQVEPFQVREQLNFKWYGTEGFKATQQVQQQISWINVLMGLPPQALNGRKLDLGPALEAINGTILGPRVAPRVLIDQRHQLTMSPELENQLLRSGFPVQVHDMDNDQEHIQKHFMEFQGEMQLPQPLLEQSNTARLAKGHILEHIKAAKAKAMAAAGAQPGQIGGPGQPRSGAAAQPPTGVQNPPGAVSPDNMPLAMPRRGA